MHLDAHNLVQQSPEMQTIMVKWFGLVIALRPQTPKHIRGGWSYYTDTSEPLNGRGAQNTVTVQSGLIIIIIIINGDL
jgi:hypothetical protein